MTAAATPTIAILCGSLRGEDSYTRRALRIAEREIAESGATVDFIDLGALRLPFCEAQDDTAGHPGTLELKRRTRAADAILLGSPEYHNSYSGVLKNALDLLGADELGGKLFGLMGVGAGDMGAINTLGHLRYVVRGVGGWSLPIQVSIAHAHEAFDGARLKDAKLEDRIKAFGRELVRFARLHACEPHLEARLTDVIDEPPDAK